MSNQTLSRLFLAALFFSYFYISADQACIGIDYHGKYNREQGPLGYQNCPCTCENSRWLIDGSCPICTHKHADGKTVGNMIVIKKDWLTGLTAYLEAARLEKHVTTVQATVSSLIE